MLASLTRRSAMLARTPRALLSTVSIPHGHSPERKAKKIMHAQRPGDGSVRTVSMFPGHGCVLRVCSLLGSGGLGFGVRLPGWHRRGLRKQQQRRVRVLAPFVTPAHYDR